MEEFDFRPYQAPLENVKEWLQLFSGEKDGSLAPCTLTKDDVDWDVIAVLTSMDLPAVVEDDRNRYSNCF